MLDVTVKVFEEDVLYLHTAIKYFQALKMPKSKDLSESAAASMAFPSGMSVRGTRAQTSQETLCTREVSLLWSLRVASVVGLARVCLGDTGL